LGDLGRAPVEYLNQRGHTSQTLLMQAVFTVDSIAKGI